MRKTATWDGEFNSYNVFLSVFIYKKPIKPYIFVPNKYWINTKDN